MQDFWEIHSFDDVQGLWGNVHSVPGRTEGRTHNDAEWYSVALYLLALGTYERLAYPFKVEKSETPDFMMKGLSGETTGLEVIRATEPWLQRAMTESEKEFRRREVQAKEAGAEIIPLPAQQGVLVIPREEAEPVSLPLSREGWLDDYAIKEWCSLICNAIENKLGDLPRYRSASHHDLLINDDTPVLVDRRHALATLSPQVRTLTAIKTPSFRTISLVMSLDVAYDVGDNCTLLNNATLSFRRLKGE